MKWITRKRPKIDRIARPWLIKNFVDRDAEFIYIPKDKVFERAKNSLPSRPLLQVPNILMKANSVPSTTLSRSTYPTLNSLTI